MENNTQNIDKLITQIKKSTGEGSKLYQKVLRKIYSELKRRKTNNEPKSKSLEYLSKELKSILESKIELKRKIRLSNNKQANEIVPDEEGLNELVVFIKDLIEDYKQLVDVEELLPTETKKIKWTGQKNTLTQLFSALKKEVNSSNMPLLSSSNEDIAVFLLKNFDCFEGNELSTIIGMLNKNTIAKKATKQITLYI